MQVPVQAAWSTHNTKIAAALNQMGFPVSVQVTERATRDDLTGDVLVQMSLHEPNAKGRPWKIKPLVIDFESGKLEREHPMHPLLVGVRANNSYQHVIAWIKEGRQCHLEYVAGSRSAVYVDGAPPPMACEEVWTTTDMSLAIACSAIGAPIVGIDGDARRHRFTIARWGLPLLMENGGFQSLDSSVLTLRAQPGKPDLAIEATQPDHPICIAYEARVIHGQLLTRIREKKRTLIIAPIEHTGRYSFVSDNPKGNVMDEVSRHLQLPTR